MQRLWDKGAPFDATISAFTVGNDPELDRRLLVDDAVASLAHATMLEQIGVLDAEELSGIASELRLIAEESERGEFSIDVEQEDCHTAIENRLTERLGDAGRRIHTGRSRNDQVLGALRLFGRRMVASVMEELVALGCKLCQLAGEHRETTLPGYTHTRQAMPSTLGLLFHAYAEQLHDTLPWMKNAYDHLNRSPLGAASGYGVALRLDRQLVSDLLRFERVQLNTLAVQNDRGRTEWLVLGSVAAPVGDLGRLASDLILLSADEFRFIQLGDPITTGSSIMPQKRNPDVFELVRATAARLRARQQEVAGVYAGLTSGYHRDLQLTKAPFIEGLEDAMLVGHVMRRALEHLKVDKARCLDAIAAATCATDEVYRRVAKGEPFRRAYRAVAEDPKGSVAQVNPKACWSERQHVGAPGNLDLELTLDSFGPWKRWIADRQADHADVLHWFRTGELP